MPQAVGIAVTKIPPFGRITPQIVTFLSGKIVFFRGLYGNFSYFCNSENKIMENKFLELEEEIVRMLKTVYDPEIPVNIYDLGLIYGVDIDNDKNVIITMTLTAPACPAADFIMEDVKMRVESISGIRNVEVKIVFEPEWHQGLMSEEAKLELGFL
jgi:FeS assembly SUF system protein